MQDGAILPVIGIIAQEEIRSRCVDGAALVAGLARFQHPTILGTTGFEWRHRSGYGGRYIVLRRLIRDDRRIITAGRRELIAWLVGSHGYIPFVWDAEGVTSIRRRSYRSIDIT